MSTTFFHRILCPSVVMLAVATSVSLAQEAPATSPAGEVATTTQTVTGRGETRAEAIADGLLQAVAQANGMRIEMNRATRIRRDAFVEDFRRQLDEFNGTDAERAELVTFATNGLVAGYEITGERRDAGTDVVELEVRIVDDSQPLARPGGRKTLAVVPFRVHHEAFLIGEAPMEAHDLNRRLVQRINDFLTSSGKFIMLDRAYDAEMRNERDRINAPGMSIAEQARLGRDLGADLLLVGTLEDAQVRAEPVFVALTGYRGVHYTGRVELALRVIDVGTSEAVWSKTLTLNFDDNDFRQIVSQQRDDRLDAILVSVAGETAGSMLMDVLHPLRVAKVREDGMVLLDAGSPRVYAGERFDVFAANGVVVDPTTDRPLAEDEVEVATVEVERVTPTLTYARVVEGDLSKVSTGAIVRRAALEEPTWDPREAPQGR